MLLSGEIQRRAIKGIKDGKIMTGTYKKNMNYFIVAANYQLICIRVHYNNEPITKLQGEGATLPL